MLIEHTQQLFGPKMTFAPGRSTTLDTMQVKGIVAIRPATPPNKYTYEECDTDNPNNTHICYVIRGSLETTGFSRWGTLYALATDCEYYYWVVGFRITDESDSNCYDYYAASPTNLVLTTMDRHMMLQMVGRRLFDT